MSAGVARRLCNARKAAITRKRKAKSLPRNKA